VDLLLLCDDSLKLLDSTVRWCFADLRRHVGEPRFAIKNCLEVKAAVMNNEVRRGKQNNFRKADVLGHPMLGGAFLDELKQFLLGCLAPLCLGSRREHFPRPAAPTKALCVFAPLP
jgi:hypothetical protein